MLFSGVNNSIVITREYYQDYGCQFLLHNFPFDTQGRETCVKSKYPYILQRNFLQMCAMVFQVQGKTVNYVQLAMDGEGIEFLGKIF